MEGRRLMAVLKRRAEDRDRMTSALITVLLKDE